MFDLFTRTLSQGLQAFVPIALWLAVASRSGRRDLARTTSAAVLLAIGLTPFAAAAFRATAYQARWELVFASVAASVVFGVVRWSWRADAAISAVGQTRLIGLLGVAAGVVLIVVRQTMEIGAVVITAFEIRSEAIVAVAEATMLAVAAALVAGWVARRAKNQTLLWAVRATMTVFLVQLLIYAFHEAAEARLLPWSAELHSATEPYGPDGIYGRYVAGLLILAPLAAGAACFARNHHSTGLTRARRLAAAHWKPALAAGGATVVCGAIVVGIGSVMAARERSRPAAAPDDLSRALAAPHVLFRHTALDAAYGRMAVAPLGNPTSRLLAPASCERISFASGRGICLQANRGVFTTYYAMLFDGTLKTIGTIKLAGSPSRTRMAPDGRVGAFTVFVSGDGYSTTGFSTRTTLVDASTGDVLGDLEQFSTWQDGKRIKAEDFNFWGVTFSRDSNLFYATLKTAGKTYLVKGDLGLRKLTVVREGIECPALSPDNRTIAFKKKIGTSAGAWRIHVLDVATLAERAVTAESRYVDDQIEWLDNARLLYAIPRQGSAITDVFVAPVDGSAPARLFIPEAASPAVVK